MECENKSVERGAGQSAMAGIVGAGAAIITCLARTGLQHGPLACIGLPSDPTVGPF